jgi:hypothetical protein
VAVKVALSKNLVAVEGTQVAVFCGGGGSEGLPGPGSTALMHACTVNSCEILAWLCTPCIRSLGQLGEWKWKKLLVILVFNVEG